MAKLTPGLAFRGNRTNVFVGPGVRLLLLRKSNLLQGASHKRGHGERSPCPAWTTSVRGCDGVCGIRRGCRSRIQHAQGPCVEWRAEKVRSMNGVIYFDPQPLSNRGVAQRQRRCRYRQGRRPNKYHTTRDCVSRGCISSHISRFVLSLYISGRKAVS
ncbi:hypothetical protein VTK73DRAFT_4282 [Phialemonium thermophilum]|uniref:Uncharacterized protein n=1 Tax=Phialemonium thermophilum TaxID=223376 RepID=A0ABR3WU79_9PEZI